METQLETQAPQDMNGTSICPELSCDAMLAWMSTGLTRCSSGRRLAYDDYYYVWCGADLNSGTPPTGLGRGHTITHPTGANHSVLGGQIVREPTDYRCWEFGQSD